VDGAVITSNMDIVAIGRSRIGAQVLTYNGFTSGSLSSSLPMLFKDAFSNGFCDSVSIFVTLRKLSSPSSMTTQGLDLYAQR
jgi:hypothetical protein